MCEPFTYSSHNKRDVKCRNGHFTNSRWFTYEKLQFVGITILGVTILDCLWDIGHKW
jgi:dsRNA-specific ribonuclease